MNEHAFTIPRLTAPNAGFGLGLRTQHYPDFLAAKQPLDWLEIITDNFLVEGGRPLKMLDTIRRDYPVVMHGVAMSIGAPQGPAHDYLLKVKALADRVQPLWISDHLCWIGSGPQQLHDLYPLPYTDEAARHIIAQIKRAQDVLQRRFVLENVSSYIDFKHSACSEWQFLSHIAQEADCLLLVDINNIYVSSFNHGFDPMAYLRGLPAHRVQQFHLAGHSNMGDHIIDTHDHPIVDPVWDLYGQACQLFGPVSAMIERDDHIPPLPELLAELDHARRIAQTCTVPPGQIAASGAAIQSGTAVSELATPASAPLLAPLQRLLSDYVLGPGDLPVAHLIREPALGDVQQRLGVYHHAYRARLTEVLADTFSKTYLFMGSDTFDSDAAQFCVSHPPLSRSLSRYGADLPAWFAARYPGNPELHELAQLDFCLRASFDGADIAALDAASAAADVDQRWLFGETPLHPGVRLLEVTTNVVQLWKAIDADQDVPPAVALPAPALLAVWRQAEQPHFRTLDTQEGVFLRQLSGGSSIAAACDILQSAGQLDDPSVLGGWLAQWWEEGLMRAEPVCMSVAA
ncbi:MAG: MNIO family bufferin maturase [Burkholderiales bacterium]